MQTPATDTPGLARLEKKYKAPLDAPACLLGHPKPDLVITQAAQQKSKNPAAPISAPPDREGRRLDNAGKRFSSMSALLVKASNALAILGRYDRQMWCDLSPYIDCIPDEDKQEARKIMQEGERTSAEVIDCAMDIATTAFRSLEGVAVLRRQGWLRATAFRPEVQHKILDLPFNGEDLFGKHVDNALQSIKKDTEAKSLGTLQYRKVPFRGSRGRGQPSYRGGYQQSRYTSYSSSSQPYRQQYTQRPAGGYTKSTPRGRGGRRETDNTRRQ